MSLEVRGQDPNKVTPYQPPTTSPYDLEAKLWNNQLANGQLGTHDIIERVRGNAHNQNVYKESLAQRLKSLADEPDDRQRLAGLHSIRNEIAEVRAAGDGQPWADAFNGDLAHFDRLAQSMIDGDEVTAQRGFGGGPRS